MSDQLQRKLKYSNHARRQMTEMTYLLERIIHKYILSWNILNFAIVVLTLEIIEYR